MGYALGGTNFSAIWPVDRVTGLAFQEIAPLAAAAVMPNPEMRAPSARVPCTAEYAKPIFLNFKITD